MRRREQLRAFRQRIRATRSGRLTLQLGVGLLGALVVAIGIVLIPFPGPGWLIVLAGLAILAIEFVWAQRLLVFTRDKLERWWHWLGRQHWSVRLLAGLVGVLFVLAVLALSLRFSLGFRSMDDVWQWFKAH
ncbi:MAG TPA: TIGR02611 family protein [Micromonosporaceae bacterium]